MAQIGKLNVQLGVDLTKFRNDMNQAFRTLNSSSAQMKRSLTGLESGFKSLTTAVGALGVGLAGVGLVQTAKSAVMAADAFNQLQAKVKNSLSDVRDFDGVFKQLQDSSNRSGVAIESVAQAFVRIRPAAQVLGKTNEDLIKFNETFAKMGALAGSTSVEMEQAMVQLSQGIASNRLSGDELRSVMEQMPQVARTIADSMGIPFEEFKQAAKEGKVTAEEVFKAILDKSAEVDVAFSNLPPSVARAVNEMNNELKVLWGAINDNVGITNSFAEAIQDLSKFIRENRDEIVQWASTIGTAVKGVTIAFGSFFSFVVSGAASVVGALSGIYGSVLELSAATINAPRVATNSLASKIPIFNKFYKPQSMVDFGGKDKLNFAGKAFGFAGDIGQLGFNLLKGFVPENKVSQPSFSIPSFSAPSIGGGGGGSGKKAKSDAGGFGGLMSLDTDLGFDLNEMALKMADEYNKKVLTLIESVQNLKTAKQEENQKFNESLAVMKALGMSYEEIHQKSLILLGLEDEQIEIRTDLNEADEMRLQLLHDIKGDTTELTKWQATLNQLMADGAINTEEYKTAMERLKEQFGPVKDKQKEMIDELTREFNQFGQEFENTLMNMLTGAEFSFKELADSFIKMITRMIIHYTIIKPILDGIANFMNGGSGGGGSSTGGFLSGIGNAIGGAIGGLFGGGKASGGPVSGGKTYLVGEKGPELFSPGSNGFITPNHQLGSGGQVVHVHNYNINAVDAPSFARLVASNKALFEGIALKANQKAFNKSGRYGPLDQAGI